MKRVQVCITTFQATSSECKIAANQVEILRVHGGLVSPSAPADILTAPEQY